MKRLGYFEKLSLAARWFLPQDEAESVVDDYKDILREIGGQEEAVKRFGPPWKPVIELSEQAFIFPIKLEICCYAVLCICLGWMLFWVD